MQLAGSKRSERRSRSWRQVLVVAVVVARAKLIALDINYAEAGHGPSGHGQEAGLECVAFDAAHRGAKRMSGARLERMESLFHAALALPSSERGAFLHAEENDAEMRAAVER